EARMKIVAAHFPMKVQAKEGEIQIENFLGEKYPRTAPLVAGVTATVEGEFVILTGLDIERVGQSAANIERATRIRNYDPRVFQDGIYLVQRAHVKEAGA
ncbi:50S ribosomal protein L6P, partial [mine drainage metagenome]